MFTARDERATLAKGSSTYPIRDDYAYLPPFPIEDNMHRIIADTDTGHGGRSAATKLTKMLIGNGAAGIHIEDQKPGTKKCGYMVVRSAGFICSARIP